MSTVNNFGLAFLVCTWFVMMLSQVEGRCPRQLRCTCIVAKTGLTVNCSGKGLTAVPSNLPNNTVELILSNNPLYKLVNGSFAHVTRLQWLFVENASLEHIDVEAFRGLEALQVLSLRDNEGLGIYNNSLQPEVFQYINNLTQLFVDRNSETSNDGLQYPTAVLSRLTKLENLTLDGISEKPFEPGMLKLRNLSSMEFDGREGTCNLKHIKADFFLNIPHLQNIYLKYCNIEYIDEDAFIHLYRLFRLDLSFNERLGLDGFENGSKGLVNSTISELILNKLYPTFGLGVELTISNMRWLKNTKLTRLEVKSNRLETIEWDLLKTTCLSTVTHLSLGDNKLTYGLYFIQFQYLSNLETVDLSKMFTSHMIKDFVGDIDTRCHTTCKRKRQEGNPLVMQKSARHTDQTSLYNKVHLGENGIEEVNSLQNILENIILSIPIPPNVKYVNASQMNLKYSIPELRFDKNVVERIFLNGNTLYSWKGPVHGLKRLKKLNLSNNFCVDLSNYFFDDASSLETLLIQHNLLSYSLENDVEGNIFKKLLNLRHLNLGYNRIHHLPANIFRGLQNISWLDLSNNRLSNLNISVQKMQHLQHLDLSYNFLTQLPDRILDDLDQLGDQVEIVLNNNSLVCSCDPLSFSFVNWLASTKVRIVSENKTQCSLESLGLGSRSLEDIQEIKTLLDRACRSYTPFILTGGGGLVLAIIAIFVMTIYRYRWKLRYLYYVSRAKYQGLGEPEDREYLYDAFISYADEDRMFVHELIDKLEIGARLRLCIHHRDFIPGRWIPDNIAAAIYNSRKCIFLLSMDFFNSYWCQFEYNMARVEEMHSGRDIVILVNVKYVPARMIPAEMWEQMEVATYITYNPDQRNENFWTNIRAALDH